MPIPRLGRRGFTFLEIMIVLAIMGYMYLSLAPNSAADKNGAEVSMMMTRAAALNYAQTTFVQANGVNSAVSQWTGAANDDARYAMLVPYIQYPPATLETYSLAGFSITFASDPRQPVTLYQGTTAISYQ
jgi:prepilin-type N-terminal cleavage/methylation domain-containing protein